MGSLDAEQTSLFSYSHTADVVPAVTRYDGSNL